MSDDSPSPALGEPETPPAAQTVVTGTRSERETELERDLEAERKMRKDREITIAHLQDENHRLKSPPQPQEPKPSKNSGWFFDDDEDEPVDQD